MEYSERFEKAKIIFNRKDKISGSISSSFDKIKQSANSIENLIYKYEAK